jgi:Tol biopolymer transport system component
MKVLFITVFLLIILAPSAIAQPSALTTGVEPSFSHDEKLIAFASIQKGHRDIFVIDELGKSRRLTNDFYWDGQPSFKLKDKAVVFVSDRSGNRELWQVGLDGENLRQLTSGEGWKSNPSIGPTGSIAFVSGRHPEHDIYILERGAIRRLTYLKDEIYSPVWSPDGKKIAFVMAGDLMVIGVDGTGLKKLESGVYHRGLSWSTEWDILYLARKFGYDLWRIDSISSDSKRLIYEGVTDSWEVNPSISGSGKIAFSTDKDGFYNIYVFDAITPYALKEPLPVPIPALVSESIPAPVENPVEAPKTALEIIEESTLEKSRDDLEEMRERFLSPI